MTLSKTRFEHSCVWQWGICTHTFDRELVSARGDTNVQTLPGMINYSSSIDSYFLHLPLTL